MITIANFIRLRRLYFIGSLTLLCISLSSLAQYNAWTRLTTTPPPYAAYDKVEVADYDADGDMDYVLLSPPVGSDRSTIFRNNGNAEFTASYDLGVFGAAAADWGDYDRDGDLDLVISGNTTTSNPATMIYRYEAGTNTFTPITLAASGYYQGDIAWIDTDADGDLDVLAYGMISTGLGPTRIWRNDGTGTFTALDGIFTINYIGGNMLTGDFNNDGLQDIVIGAAASSQSGIHLYTNMGGNTFSFRRIHTVADTDADLKQVDNDNDGDLDIVFTGSSDGGTLRNNGNDASGIPAFTRSFFPFEYNNSSIQIADFDNNGRPDFMIQGRRSGTQACDVYRHTTVNNWVLNTTNLFGMLNGTVRVGYFNNDALLDVIQTGQTTTTRHVGLSIGNSNMVASPTAGVVNAAPGIPTGLSATTINCSSMRINWSHAIDDYTNQNVLRYDIRIGTTPGGSNVRRPAANLSTGKRYHMENGLVTRTFGGFLVTGLTLNTTYYYAIQAVDANGLGGGWSAEQTITLSTPLAISQSLTIVSGNFLEVDARLSTTGTATYSWTRAAVPGIANSASTLATSIIYERLINTTSTPKVVVYNVTAVQGACTYNYDISVTVSPMLESVPPPTIFSSRTTHAWADFDRDGDKDIFILGPTNTGPKAEIWVNNGTGQFTSIVTIAGLEPLGNGSVDVGDVNNDGWPDIVINGANTLQQPRTQVWKNNGNGTFSIIANTIRATHTGMVSLGDSDNDGDLDLLVTGVDQAINRYTELWINDGTGVFSHANWLSLPGIANRGVKWFDMDSDGDLDFFVNGQGAGIKISRLYRNLGGNQFESTGDYITPISHGNFDAMDYDGDGDIDLIISGDKGSSNYVTEVWNNNSAGVFSLASNPFTGVALSSIHWLDINKDGNRDVVISGITPSSVRVTEAWCFFSGGVGWVKTDIAPGLELADISSGDADNDGDLDLLITGGTGSSSATFLLLNRTDYAVNVAPTAVSSISVASIDCGTVRINFIRATDANQSSGSLTYAIRIGATSGGNQVMSGMALSNGYRLLAGHGKIIQFTNGLVVRNLAPGTYYMSIQAIDLHGVGGPWSAERTFNVVAPPILSSALTRQVCSGAAFNYSATSTTTGLTFSWSRAATSGISNAATSASGNAISEVLTNTTTAPIVVPYTVTLTTNYGCVVNTTVNVTVNPLPVQPVLSMGDNQFACAGNVVSVMNAASYTGATISWLGGQTGATYTVLLGHQTVRPTVTSAAGCVTEGASLSVLGRAPGSWLGNRNSVWHDAANWCGGVPTASTNVFIEANDPIMPVVQAAASIGSINIPAGKSILINGPYTLDLWGNKTGPGLILGTTDSELRLRGNGNQELNTALVGKLTITTPGTVTVSGKVTLWNQLSILNGSVVTTDASRNIVNIHGNNTPDPIISTTGNVQVPIARRGVAVGQGGFSGLGVQLSSGADDLDTIYVERRYAASSGLGNSGIACTWRIRAHRQPTSGRTLTLSWPSAQTAGKNLGAMQVWRRPDGGNQWLKVGATQNLTAIAANPFISVTTNSFSDWTVSDANSPLPVTWLSVNALAMSGHTSVSWSTAQELNNAGFTVQYSPDGLTWDSVTYLDVANSHSRNANTPLYYTIEDRPREGGYYRIRQHDLDGTVSYSPVVQLRSKKHDKPVSLVPNPSRDYVMLHGLEEATTVLIMDAKGKQVMEANLMPGEVLNVRSLASGVYALRHGEQVLRLVKD